MAVAPLRREGPRRPDRAVRWSLVGHGLLLLLVLVGGLTLPRTPPPTQLAIKATVVEGNATRRSPVAPPPAPKVKPTPEAQAQPETKKVEPKVEPTVEPKPDPALEQRQAEQREKALQEKQRAEQAKAQQVAAKRQQQEKDKQAREAAAQAKQEKAQQEQEKQAREKAAADKLQAEKLKAEQQKEQAAAREMARQLEAEERLQAAADSGALAEYQAMIRQKVTRNWIRPPSAATGLECEVVVTQIPGGQVIGVQIERCNGDEAVRRSIEAAVLKSSPLPLPDDLALFERSLRFTFKPEQ